MTSTRRSRWVLAGLLANQGKSSHPSGRIFFWEIITPQDWITLYCDLFSKKVTGHVRILYQGVAVRQMVQHYFIFERIVWKRCHGYNLNWFKKWQFAGVQPSTSAPGGHVIRWHYSSWGLNLCITVYLAELVWGLARLTVGVKSKKEAYKYDACVLRVNSTGSVCGTNP